MYCSKGAQPLPKAIVINTTVRGKIPFGPLTPLSGALTTRPLRPGSCLLHTCLLRFLLACSWSTELLPLSKHKVSLSDKTKSQPQVVTSSVADNRTTKTVVGDATALRPTHSWKMYDLPTPAPAISVPPAADVWNGCLALRTTQTPTICTRYFFRTVKRRSDRPSIRASHYSPPL